MKVAQVMAGDEEGGLEKHFVELCNGLAAQGIEVVAIACAKYRNRFNPRITFEAMDLTRGRRDPRVLFQLWRVLRRHQPDLVHAQASKAAAMIAPLLRWLNCPAVATIHNLKKHLAFLRPFHALIGVSHTVSGTIPHKNVHTVYNGVAMPTALSQEERLRLRQTLPGVGRAPLWLAVGRLVPAKGFDTLIEAFAGCHGTLLIVGDGPDYALLQQRIKSHPQSSCIHLLGHRDDIPALMQACDVVVISSRREGFSYVFAEALLCGIPVVSTDIPIPNEVLDKKWLCKIEDPHALHKLLQKASSFIEAGHAMYEEPFQLARTQLSLDAMLKNTQCVYSSLLSQKDS